MDKIQITKAILMLLLVIIAGCSKESTTQDDLKKYFSNHKIGSSPDYAIMKNGTDYLATIHGYMDDQSVCLSIIKPLNEDPSLSVMPGTYTCVPLNH